MRRTATFKSLVPLLIVLILILAICCLPAQQHPVDLLVPSFATAVVALAIAWPELTTRREQFGPALKVHLATAPDRAPPVA
jgi:ABC-type uncharacterized transport system permease subunit